MCPSPWQHRRGRGTLQVDPGCCVPHGGRRLQRASGGSCLHRLSPACRDCPCPAERTGPAGSVATLPPRKWRVGLQSPVLRPSRAAEPGASREPGTAHQCGTWWRPLCPAEAPAPPRAPAEPCFHGCSPGMYRPGTAPLGGWVTYTPGLVPGASRAFPSLGPGPSCPHLPWHPAPHTNLWAAHPGEDP